ncbi:Intramolecular chaperone auto-processing domain containing protein [uncultured Caudovirales phage]|uniref:Intramolecular chaperone auto-processing domain containing protein n=1 Tax=uncultured Caudovirales phage TaxID=2100421 RepID=A0A6J5MFI2_9CAUD|nr:Intramolecular chaperone auto-processing domain containing protein [uncultured Caudovirales phage]
MKQLLFLLLFPCLAMAQYQGNGNQKITLGEQTTADGLVWRGRLADTANLLTNKLDTSVYIVLDTGTRAMWYYRASTTPKWTRLVDSLNNMQGQLSLTTKVTGVLPVANGGTGNTSLDAADIVTKSGTQTIGGAKTFTSAVTGASFRPTSPTIPTNGIYLPNANTLGFSTNGTNKMTLNSGGNIGIGIVPNSDWNTGYTVLQTNYATYASENARIGQALFVFNAYNTDPADAAAWKRVYGNNAGMYEQSSGNHKWYTASSGAANSAISWVEGMTLSSNAGLSVGTATAAPANGIVSNGEVWIGYTSDNGAYPLQVNGQIFATNATIATSDEKYKENITPLNKGLEIVNKLKPVTFNFISDTENNFSQYEEVGFIAQDVDRALSTESFSKSIVKAADDSEPTSTMGLATQNLIPILVKAIQEQQALIKALEQRLLILENK